MKIITWFDGTLSFPAREDGAPLTLSFDRPADCPWDERHWFCFDVEVDQFSDATVLVRFIPPEPEAPVVIRYQLLPGRVVPFRVCLDELWSRRHFLPVFPGSYKGHVNGFPLDPRHVTRVEIVVQPGRDFTGAQLGRVYVADEEPAGITADAPMVDEMGQLIGYEWPTKTHSVQEMEERLREELRRAKEEPGSPRPVSAYGGYLQKRFEATGWFRTQHDGQRW